MGLLAISNLFLPVSMPAGLGCGWGHTRSRTARVSDWVIDGFYARWVGLWMGTLFENRRV